MPLPAELRHRGSVARRQEGLARLDRDAMRDIVLVPAGRSIRSAILLVAERVL
jgi:hypothetical protein